MHFRLDAVGKKGLQERLIWDISFVRKTLQVIQKRFRQADGNRLRRGFQFGKRGCFGIIPVHEIYLAKIIGNDNLLINNPFETPSELEERNVLFMEEGWEIYLSKMFKQMLKCSVNPEI